MNVLVFNDNAKKLTWLFDRIPLITLRHTRKISQLLLLMIASIVNGANLTLFLTEFTPSSQMIVILLTMLT